MISLSQDGAQPEREHRILYRLRAVTGPGGEIRFAGQQIAAAHAAAILDLLRTGRLVASGLVPQEAIPPQAVLQNRFLTWLHEPAAQSFEGKDE
jgi:hypothetical protein